MTATFTFMKEEVDELLKKYPDRKFYSIDTKAITIGSYNIVIVDKMFTLNFQVKFLQLHNLLQEALS